MANAPKRVLGAAAALALGLAGPALAQTPPSVMGKVPVTPYGLDTGWTVGKPSPRACLDSSTIAGAVVVDPVTVDVIQRGGQRWRLILDRDCPQLSYYGGFYYRAGAAGQFCAGRDRIIGRAGGECRVRAIAPMQRQRPRR
ncbi:MAG: hypothetical protein ACK4Z0_06040 [Sphingomonadaceae bacterium]